MAMVNVNRKISDQFYRYKMPKLIAKVEGKGNGIKTVIVNMGDIAKSLERPPAYPTKYFGCELGAQTQIDKKNERYIVNGAHDADKLQELLDGFIEKFVLCPDCDNPETKLTVQVKKEKINQQCIACGYHGQINLVHRLVVFILKNPPGVETTVTPQKGKKGKGKKDQNGEAESPTSDKPEGPFVENGKIPTSDGSFEDDWGDDVSAYAVQERMENLSQGIKGLVVNQEMEKTQEERMNIFFHFVEQKKASKIEDCSKEIKDKAEQLDVEDKAVLVLAELLFTEEMVLEIKKYRKLFLRFLHGNQKAQKYLLGAFEILVGKSYPDKLMAKIPHLLKAFYDNDLVEEEVFIEWGAKVSKRYVSKEIANGIHEKASPFITWLKTAEEESSEEEEDDIQVVYSTAPAPVQVETKEDDFDIDDI